MSVSVVDACLLAGGSGGPAALRPLVAEVLGALTEGAGERCGPLPRGGPGVVARRVREVVGAALPEAGVGPGSALRHLVRVVAQGAADPADPQCAAHLHCPPLAVAVAADLAASALNPSLDSWDQAPAASELESLVCGELAELVFGGRRGGEAGGGAGAGVGRGLVPDALVTTGGTESNQLGVLMARERLGGAVRIVCGENAHHSVHRAAWLLGLAGPVVVAAPRGVLDPGAVAEELARPGPAALVVATAGTTDAGAVDPLAELAAVAARFGARLHVDAAYGGPLLFSEVLRGRLAGLERADSVTLDLHKLGWQPVAAGLFVVPDGGDLRVLDHRVDYLNAGDDAEAGLPDLLGRSLRTTRRPDVLKIAVTLRALGRRGMAELVERACAAAVELAELVDREESLELRSAPELTTVVFRPVGVADEVVADVRRRLLVDGTVVLGRASLDGRLWLKATLLHPRVEAGDLAALLKLVCDAVPRGADGRAGAEGVAGA